MTDLPYSVEVATSFAVCPTGHCIEMRPDPDEFRACLYGKDGFQTSQWIAFPKDSGWADVPHLSLVQNARQWLDYNAEGAWRLDTQIRKREDGEGIQSRCAVCFASDDDAALFRLTWC